jgi:hypothetical protein
MKTLLSVSIVSLGLFAGAAQAADASQGVFAQINATAPRSSVFQDLNNTAPRSFQELNDTAPRSSIFDDLNKTAPRSDGVFGTLEVSAP